MLFGFCWGLPFVAVDNCAVSPTLEIQFHDGFDAGSNRSGAAFVGSAFDEFVELGEKRLGKSHGNLFGGHWASIPTRYATWYATLVTHFAERGAGSGTSKPTVSRYENGLVDPGTETLSRLLHACGRELRSEAVGLPSSADEVRSRFEGRSGPSSDDVTRTKDGRSLRTAADLEAFAAELIASANLTAR